jgi:hypothetical protein
MIKQKIDLKTAFANKCNLDFNSLLMVLQANKPIFWSWGAVGWCRIGEKALRFKSNGYHHKGHVYISLNGKDLYDVLLTSMMGTIIDEIKDIYWDDLVEIIDNRIEKIPEYIR